MCPWLCHSLGNEIHHNNVECLQATHASTLSSLLCTIGCQVYNEVGHYGAVYAGAAREVNSNEGQNEGGGR